MLNYYGLNPTDLEFEITETVVMDSIGAGGFESLALFAKRSLRIALDDFGTGHSSLAYLRQLPAHTIKIDRSFVSAIGDQGDSDRIVEAIIGLATPLAKPFWAKASKHNIKAGFCATIDVKSPKGFSTAKQCRSKSLTLWLSMRLEDERFVRAWAALRPAFLSSFAVKIENDTFMAEFTLRKHCSLSKTSNMMAGQLAKHGVAPPSSPWSQTPSQAASNPTCNRPWTISNHWD